MNEFKSETSARARWGDGYRTRRRVGRFIGGLRDVVLSSSVRGSGAWRILSVDRHRTEKDGLCHSRVSVVVSARSITGARAIFVVTRRVSNRSERGYRRTVWTAKGVLISPDGGSTTATQPSGIREFIMAHFPPRLNLTIIPPCGILNHENDPKSDPVDPVPRIPMRCRLPRAGDTEP